MTKIEYGFDANNLLVNIGLSALPQYATRLRAALARRYGPGEGHATEATWEGRITKLDFAADEGSAVALFTNKESEGEADQGEEKGQEKSDDEETHQQKADE